MRRSIILVALVCFAGYSRAQKIIGKLDKDTVFQFGKKSSPATRLEFYNYFLPSSLAKQDFAPASVSSVGIDFGDDEVSFKFGTTTNKATETGKTDTADKKSYKESWFVGGTIAADNGQSKFLKNGKFVPGYSVKGGYTFKVKDNTWVYRGYEDSVSSKRFAWINLTGKLNWNSFNIFYNDSQYVKKTPLGFQVMIFINNYFHSRIRRFKPRNSIISVGLGFGRFNNYTILDDEFSYKEGRVLSNGAFLQTDEITGRKGDFENFFGGIYALDLYKSLIRSPGATLYLGGRANGYIGSYGNINTTLGLYFSKTDSKAGEKEEKFGFVIAGNLPNTQKFDWNSYLRKKAYMSFSAIIPLKFNL